MKLNPWETLARGYAAVADPVHAKIRAVVSTVADETE